jgi:hypothetical protein
MTKNTIDDHLNKLLGHDDGVEFGSGYHDECQQEIAEAKQALYQDLMELSDEYDMNDVMMIEHRTGKPLKAIPVEKLNQYFGKDS